MNLSIGTYGAFDSGLYGSSYPDGGFSLIGGTSGIPGKEDEAKTLTPAEEKAQEEREQEAKERMGITDPKGIVDPLKKKDPTEECETCKKRKYQDGSDEMVSFKSAAHISPESAAARVRAHEQEHVSNAYKKAAKDNGKVISASVSIHTAVCPECGRTYVSGGTTHTQIKYYNEDNPYQKGLKTADQAKYAGMNLDYAV